MKDYSNSEVEEEKQKKKKIILIILIILLLLLITSCTSKFFGTIGNLFHNIGYFDINDKTNDPESIVNRELRFYSDSYDMYMNDSKVKLGFTYELINPDQLVCTTSDAEIATCYVDGNYVVVTPKKVGKVEVILQTTVNGKVYKAIAKVNVLDASQGIYLFKESDTININYTDEYIFSYRVDGIRGKITVTSSDESIAKAIIENGVIKIIPVRPGTVTITITIEDENGKVTIKEFEVTITGDPNKNTSNPTKPSNPNGNGGSTSGDRDKDRNSLLKSLGISSGTLNFNPGVYSYNVGVGSNVSNVTLTPVLSSSKANMTFTFNGKEVSSLNDLKLKTGDNTVIITVRAEDGSVSKYTVVINKAADKDNTLSSLTVNNGEMSPTFSKDELNYNVYVTNGSSFDIKSTLSSPKSKVEYIYNGQKVDSLDGLKLENGHSTVQIKVTSEDGVDRIYTVHVYPKKSDNNKLSNLEAIGFEMDEKFASDHNSYHVSVPYETSKISFTAVAEDTRSTVTYKLSNKTFNGKIDSLENIPLVEGDNLVEVTVTSESGISNTYTITVHRAERSIALESNEHVINFENTPYPVVYYILDDGNKTSSYDYHDVKVSFSNYKGTYEIQDGKIILNPDVSMKNKTTEIEVRYFDKVVKGTLKFEMNHYTLTPDSSSYELDLDNGEGTQDIILNTNLFSKGTVVSNIPGGIRISSKEDPRLYVDVKTDSKLITLSGKNEDGKVSSVAITATATGKSGVATISVSGSAFGETVATFPVQITLVQKYDVVIYANGGFFQKYETDSVSFRVSNLEAIDLTEYVAYKEATGNCMYYVLDHFNTKEDGSGTKYGTNDIIKNLDHDLTLYAIYNTKESQYIEVTIPAHYYLYDEDDRGIELFHNDEYFKLYGKDKIIYPGARGSYVQTIMNRDNQKIEITGMNLEEDTICITGKGCLNMGYIIKYSPVNSNNTHYYYGSSTQYSILNKDSATSINQSHTSRNIPFTPNTIGIPNGEGVEISLLWEWVDVDDDLDTLIGMEAANLNDEYKLTVRIDFTRLHSHCKLD